MIYNIICLVYIAWWRASVPDTLRYLARVLKLSSLLGGLLPSTFILTPGREQPSGQTSEYE